MKLPVPILLRVLRAGAVAWVSARLMLAMAGAGELYREGYMLFMAIVAALIWIDIRYARERVFFANLGVSMAGILVVGVAAAVSLEVALGPVVRPLLVTIAQFAQGLAA